MLDASPISRLLWVGAAPPPGRYQKYFDVIVFTAEEVQPPDEDYPGVRVRRFPFADEDPASDEDMLTAWDAAEAVARDMDRGRRVLVTCAMGRNRSALVAALALYLQGGFTGPQAMTRLRMRRRDRFGNRALSNPAFQALLLNLS